MLMVPMLVVAPLAVTGGGTLFQDIASPSSDTGAVSPSEPAGAQASSFSVSLDVATAYSFRGINVFQAQGQHDRHMLLAPAATWSVGDTGVWVGYWGAYQLNGDNRSYLVDAGYGRETDVTLGFDKDLEDGWGTLSLSLVAYLYPFADPELGGAHVPTWLEPMVGLVLDRQVELSLVVSYFTHVQKALDGGDYVYFNPTVARTFPLREHWDLRAALSAGAKLWADGPTWQDNTVDATGSVTVSYSRGAWSVTPGLHGTWTNLGGLAIQDQAFAWGDLGVSVEW